MEAAVLRPPAAFPHFILLPSSFLISLRPPSPTFYLLLFTFYFLVLRPLSEFQRVQLSNFLFPENRYAMSRLLLDSISVADIGCWCVCFWWMHRISSRQNAMLEQLRGQAHRIEKISEEEHAILTELHLNVEAIQRGVDEVTQKVDRVETQTNEANTK